MAEIVLEDVSRIHADGTAALANLDLCVADGELLALVGPSGSGKTTTLRVIAGLDPLAGGTIRIDGRVVNDLRPGERGVGMVAQEIALYPHMDVAANLGFGLRVRKVDPAEVDRRVRAEARALGLTGLLRRRPRTLSAGSQQKVALGRAGASGPRILQLDEPLTHLDAGQRHQVRQEIAQVQRGAGVTMLYATNDPLEAMVLGDRVAVLSAGVLQQVAPPAELYARPVNLFVASTVGSPPMNELRGRLDYSPDASYLWLGDTPVTLGRGLPPLLRARDGAPVAVGVRAEGVTPAGAGRAVALRGTVTRVERLGHADLVWCAVGPASAAQRIVARMPATARTRAGDRLDLSLDARRMSVFDLPSEVALWHGAGERG